MKYNKESIESDIDKIYKDLKEIHDKYGEDYYTADLRVKIMILECLNKIADSYDRS